MPDYRIVFCRSARKELEDLDNILIDRILARIEDLGNNPRPAGCLKLHGGGNLWRARVGEYRIIYAIDDREKTVDIRIIRHRKNAYG